MSRGAEDSSTGLDNQEIWKLPRRGVLLETCHRMANALGVELMGLLSQL